MYNKIYILIPSTAVLCALYPGFNAIFIYFQKINRLITVVSMYVFSSYLPTARGTTIGGDGGNCFLDLHCVDSQLDHFVGVFENTNIIVTLYLAIFIPFLIVNTLTTVASRNTCRLCLHPEAPLLVVPEGNFLRFALC